MPKQTFFHLPADKQDILVRAAKKEFSRVPLHEAAIANIIKEADIPRGSFYQYFEGKEDLYYYLLNQISKKNSDHFIAILKERNGDIFEAFTDSFRFMIQNRGNQQHKEFFENAFLNMNYKIENILSNNLYERSRKDQYLSTISLMNTEILNLKEEQEIHHVLKIIISVTFQNFVQIFVKNLTEEEALQNYMGQMELLKRGLYKGDDS